MAPMSEALAYALSAAAAVLAALAAAFHGAIVGWLCWQDDRGSAALAFFVPADGQLVLGGGLAVAAFRAIKR
jgi:hypothetical protein